MSVADECPVLAVAISEFDIDRGNTLTSYWPQRFDWTRFEETNIADLCLPDGGHLHTEDWTYLFLHQKPSAPGSGGASSGGMPAKRQIKKIDPPRSLAASTGGSSGGTSPGGALSPLNTAAVAELGARTRADSLTPALSPRVAPSPRKTLSDISENPITGGDGGASAGANGGNPSNSSSGSQSHQNDLVYGIAMFHNKADKTVRRGAIQKSLLLILKAPIFDVYLDILRHSVVHIIETGDKAALKTLFDAMKASWGAKDLSVFGKTFPYQISTPIANLKPDQFGSASLKELVQRFGVDTMYLWYTMLLRQRILFSGQPAHLVGECCLACPLLVAPLHGFARNISPYVALTDISPLERKHYICGTTNSIMETHTHRYDMMASFSTGIVRKSNAKLSAMDKEFILNVISGMSAKGEKWVRDQFFNYTKRFLDSVASNTYKSAQHKALGEPFKLSDLYENYVTLIKNAGPLNNMGPGGGSGGAGGAGGGGGGESLDSITSTLHQATSGKLTLSDAKTKQLLWDLLQRLVDLNTIDELCEKNILAVITPMLDSNSAQVRKYAVATLAQIAISIKGQISLIQHNLIPRVVLMLRDPMPNVASAAAYCLYKISSLFIGVTALVQHRVPKMLLNIICSSEDNLTLKISTAETLLQIHRLDPTLPIVGHDNIKMMIRSTSDVTFRNVLLLLLDLWGEARLPIKTNETIEFHLASLRAGGLDVRTGSTSMLLSSLAQDRNLLLQIIAAGGIQVIAKNLTQTPREEPLARLSMAILCLACDVSMGRSSLIGYGAIPTVLAEFQATDFALHLYYVCRFFEVACQYPDTTEVFLESHGLEALVSTILKYAEKPSLQTLTMPCLGALKYLALLNPVLLHKHPELVATFGPVAELYRRMIKKAYDQLISMPTPHIQNMMQSNGSASSSSSTLAFEIVLAGCSGPDERDFYQLLNIVVSLWSPSSLENVVTSSTGSKKLSSPNRGVGSSSGGTKNGSGSKGADAISSSGSGGRKSLGHDDDDDDDDDDEDDDSNPSSKLLVPEIDDELRLASEKLVTLLSSQSRRSRRGTSSGSPKSTTRGLDAINETDSEESLSRKASIVLERKGDQDDDLMAAADSILADLGVGMTSSPSLSRKPSTTLNLQQVSSSSLTGAIDAMDDGIDQLLADIASETIRSARSRSTTATDLEINEAMQEVAGTGSSLDQTDTPFSSKSSARHSPPGSTKILSPHLSVGEDSAQAGAGAMNSPPRSFASALGGTGMLGASSAPRRPRFVPQLNVGDMWDDIADLTTSILAEVPSEPSTPSTQGSAASFRGPASEPSSRDSPLHRSSESNETGHPLDSARSKRRSSLNLSSSGAFDLDREYSMGGSSPHFGRAALRPASGHASPAGGSPRSGSSPASVDYFTGSAPHAASYSSPRRKKSSPRLDVVLENDSSASPKRERSHSRKTSGGGAVTSSSTRPHSPGRHRSLADIQLQEEHGGGAGGNGDSSTGGSTDSPGRRSKSSNRRSIQILTPTSSSTEMIGGGSGIDSSSSNNTGSFELPEKDESGSHSQYNPSPSPARSSSKDRKAKRLSSELADVIDSLSSLTLPSTPEDPSEAKKLKRKSSTRMKDKDIEKKDKIKKDKKPKE